MIFLACAFTAAAETALFALLGYRRVWQLVVVACANIASNLLLNLAAALCFPGGVGAWVWLLEAAVVAAEYAVYAIAFAPGWRLFVLTLAANAVTYGLGLVVF